MANAEAAPVPESGQDQFFVQAICAVGGLVLLFHPLIFIWNQAMLDVLEGHAYKSQWPEQYCYLPVIAGLFFLMTAGFRTYRPGLSGVFALEAVIAGSAYACMLFFGTLKQTVAARPREYVPGVGSWILLLLSLIPPLAAGVLASCDSRRFEPLLATWLRSAASACVLLLVGVLGLGDTGTPAGFWRAVIFGPFLSAFYFLAMFHTGNKRSFAIGTASAIRWRWFQSFSLFWHCRISEGRSPRKRLGTRCS